MFIYDNYNVNEEGHLTVSGVDTVKLAKEYSTPLYVMDEAVLRENIRSFKDAFDKYYDGRGLVCYASKAFCCKQMCRIASQEGIGLDVVSGGELFTALSAEVNPENICFHGNNKSNEELEMAVKAGVGRIVVDNLPELERLQAISARYNATSGIMLRIKPGIDAHTHDFVKTGQIDSKFGFALETGEAFDAIRASIEYPNVRLRGIHCHIGSQILDDDPFVLAAEVMLTLIAKVKQELGYELEELNLGGGFGIKYTGNDNPKAYSEYIKTVSSAVDAKCGELGICRPFMLVEPGRSVAGPAGVTLYTVGAVKEIPNIRTYVSVDGGMCDNPRYILYSSEYEATIANRAAEERTETITLAGKCCETGDLLGENMKLQPACSGDIVAVFSTGAYNYSMSSNYNRNKKPAVVFVANGKSYLAVRGESYEDVISHDI